MSIYRFSVSWTVAATMETEADSLEEAKEKIDKMILPQGEYSSGSFHFDSVDVDGEEVLLEDDCSAP